MKHLHVLYAILILNMTLMLSALGYDDKKSYDYSLKRCLLKNDQEKQNPLLFAEPQSINVSAERVKETPLSVRLSAFIKQRISSDERYEIFLRTSAGDIFSGYGKVNTRIILGSTFKLDKNNLPISFYCRVEGNRMRVQNSDGHMDMSDSDGQGWLKYNKENPNDPKVYVGAAIYGYEDRKVGNFTTFSSSNSNNDYLKAIQLFINLNGEGSIELKVKHSKMKT